MGRARSRMAEAMARHDALVTTAADRHGGYVFATGGDCSAWPSTGRDATAWAGELQAAMEGQQWPGHLEFGVRIGLHTGETEERGKAISGRP